MPLEYTSVLHTPNAIKEQRWWRSLSFCSDCGVDFASAGVSTVYVEQYHTSTSIKYWPVTVLGRANVLVVDPHLAFTVTAWSTASFNAGIVGSNPTQGMGVCVRLFCVGSGLATGRSPVQRVLPTVYTINKLKKRPRSNKGLRIVEP
jgi:hypothetical protein